ncbi:hypothetical protein, partial [Flavobacterium aurantiibacter]|uniref:hypothetical protein n=1 Tax=Flavobacterium aurantiibacter TaxID=2023067 RepID=UPI001A9C7EE1
MAITKFTPNLMHLFYFIKKIKKHFFHPDHLGSSTYISNNLGQVSQRLVPIIIGNAEYLPFGEIVALAE